MTSDLTSLMGVLFLLALVSSPLCANDTSMQPPEPSYSDQWTSAKEGSSPFLDLRNRDREVSPPEPPSVDTGNVQGETVPSPDRADTVTAGDSPGEPDTETKEIEQTEKDTGVQETSPENKEGPSDTMTVSKSSGSDTGEPSPTDEGDTESTESSSDTEAEGRMSPAVEEDQPPERRAETTQVPASDTVSVDPEPDPSPSEEERRENTNLTRTFFESASPRDPGGVQRTSEIIGGTLPEVPMTFGTTRSDTVLAGGVQYPTRNVPFWWRYFGWIAGGLVVSVMIGMFFWFRRRRVKVVETRQSPTDDFFQEQFKRRETSSLRGSKDRVERVEISDFSQGEPSTANQPNPSRAGYEVLAERLREEGFNGQFEELIQLYYEEQLTKEEIAERTSRGLGEVGLVIDYADRLRKDMDHGKRA